MIDVRRLEIKGRCLFCAAAPKTEQRHCSHCKGHKERVQANGVPLLAYAAGAHDLAELSQRLAILIEDAPDRYAVSVQALADSKHRDGIRLGLAIAQRAIEELRSRRVGGPGDAA
jgi:hypothetical protein